MAKLKYWNGTDWVAAVVGAQGTQGVQGTQGIQGVQGTQGIQGAQGIQGIQGIIGDDGFVAQTDPPENTSLLWLDTDEPAEVSGVNQILAGNNVTISPEGGTGVVTVNSISGDSDQLVIPSRMFQ